MTFKVKGARKDDGKDVEMIFIAESAESAGKLANENGILVESVSLERYEKTTTRVRKPLPTSSIRGGKLFLIITASVACGITLAMIAWAVFFVGVGSALPNLRTATPRDVKPSMGVAEKSFLDDVSFGNIESVRTSLVGKLDWNEVATPALKSLVEIGRLFHGGDELDESRRDREFWTSLSERLVQNGADVNLSMPHAHDISSIDFLITHGANVDAVDESGNTVLENHAGNDIWKDEIAYLIMKGANVNVVDGNGNTPLHTAAKNNAVAVIGLLLSAGAKINAKNANGQTPLAVANLSIQPDAAVLLKRSGGIE